MTMTTDKIYDIWNALKETNSYNAKRDILLANKDNETLRDWLFYTYNPYYNFGIRYVPDEVWNLPEIKPLKPNPNVNKDFFNLLDKLRNREITGNAAKDAVCEFCLANGDETMELLNATLNKDIDCGVSVNTINKIWQGLIPVFSIAKANPFKEPELPAIAQEKMNGVRAIALVNYPEITIYSSNGNAVSENCLTHLKSEISKVVESSGCDVFVLDGEIVAENRRSVSGTFNKALKGTLKEGEEIKSGLQYVVFDLLPMYVWENHDESEIQETRHKQLETLLKEYKGNSIRVVDTRVVISLREIEAFYKEVYNSGGEGLIIKSPNAPYIFSRSDSWLKIKSEKSCDLKITGFTSGTGKRANKIGAICAESSDGKIKVNVGSGLKDDDLDYITENKENLIGKIVEVLYNEIIKDKDNEFSLFLPRFLEIRNDKDCADSFEKILDESNGGEL